MNEPTSEELARIPPLYSKEVIPTRDKLMYEHFFIFACDWYVAEYDPKEQIFFGYAILNNDYQNAEWGYVCFRELKAINIRGFEVERDIHWQLKKAVSIDKIVQNGGVSF